MTRRVETDRTGPTLSGTHVGAIQTAFAHATGHLQFLDVDFEHAAQASDVNRTRIERTERDARRGMPADMDGVYVCALSLTDWRAPSAKADTDKEDAPTYWVRYEWVACECCGWAAPSRHVDTGEYDFADVLDEAPWPLGRGLTDSVGFNHYLFCEACDESQLRVWATVLSDKVRAEDAERYREPSELDRLVSARMDKVIADLHEQFTGEV